MTGDPFGCPRAGSIDRSRLLQLPLQRPQTTRATRATPWPPPCWPMGSTWSGRSFKYHRPRGIMAAGAEEPNALVQVGEDPRTDPNIKATQLELVDGLKAVRRRIAGPRWTSTCKAL